MKLYIGCDPGWTNLAWAILGETDDVLLTGVVAPSSLPGATTPQVVRDALLEVESSLGEFCEVSNAVMERFVYYEGVHNPDSERILMVTGQMQFFLRDRHDILPVMVRAYDWKSRLSKHLFKKGFRNRSDSLDKVFSLDAAKFLFPDYTFNTDHEADAACMSYIARMLSND